jgi:hypothetical protein
MTNGHDHDVYFVLDFICFDIEHFLENIYFFSFYFLVFCTTKNLGKIESIFG